MREFVFTIVLLLRAPHRIAGQNDAYYTLGRCAAAMSVNDANGDERISTVEFINVMRTLSPYPGCPDMSNINDFIGDEGVYKLFFDRLSCLCELYDDNSNCCATPTLAVPGVYPPAYTEQVCQSIAQRIEADCGTPAPTGPTVAPTRAPVLSPTASPVAVPAPVASTRIPTVDIIEATPAPVIVDSNTTTDDNVVVVPPDGDDDDPPSVIIGATVGAGALSLLMMALLISHHRRRAASKAAKGALEDNEPTESSTEPEHNSKMSKLLKSLHLDGDVEAALLDMAAADAVGPAGSGGAAPLATAASTEEKRSERKLDPEQSRSVRSANSIEIFDNDTGSDTSGSSSNKPESLLSGTVLLRGSAGSPINLNATQSPSRRHARRRRLGSSTDEDDAESETGWSDERDASDDSEPEDNIDLEGVHSLSVSPLASPTSPSASVTNKQYSWSRKRAPPSSSTEEDSVAAAAARLSGRNTIDASAQNGTATTTRTQANGQPPSPSVVTPQSEVPSKEEEKAWSVVRSFGGIFMV